MRAMALNCIYTYRAVYFSQRLSFNVVHSLCISQSGCVYIIFFFVHSEVMLKASMCMDAEYESEDILTSAVSSKA